MDKTKICSKRMEVADHILVEWLIKEDNWRDATLPQLRWMLYTINDTPRLKYKRNIIEVVPQIEALLRDKVINEVLD